MLSIWEERSVYEDDVLDQLKHALCKYRVLIPFSGSQEDTSFIDFMFLNQMEIRRPGSGLMTKLRWMRMKIVPLWGPQVSHHR